MVEMTDGVEPRCKVKLSWSTQNSDETGSSHPLYRRMVVPCLRDSATLSVSWWYTSMEDGHRICMLVLAPAGSADETRHARGAFEDERNSSPLEK